MTSRMIILGPPGAGKGTQAAMLCEHLGIPAISTGAIFRKNVSEGTELGKIAQGYIDKGEYVPDEVTEALVRDRLAQPDCENGFLLDGYPRTVHQVEALDKMLAGSGHTLNLAIELVADREALVDRLLKRAEIENRADDTEEVIRHRMDVYVEETRPLSAIYGDRGILVRVDGLGSIDEVRTRLEQAMADAKSRGQL